MKEVPFHQLSRAIQDRFLGSVRGAEPPSPIVAIRGGLRAAYLALLLPALGAIGVFLLYRHAFGDLESGVSVQPMVPFVLAYAALFAAALFGLLHALAARNATAALPYPPGIYVFPTSLVDARRDVLRVWGMDEVTELKVVGSNLQLIAGGTPYVFPCANSAVADAALLSIREAQKNERDSDYGKTMAPAMRASIDPLCEPRFSSPLAPQDPLPAYRPLWARLRIPVAIALGVAAGSSLQQLRNGKSDERMFATARGRNDIAGYQAYLKNGARHRDEVAQKLLPRAELRVAERAGTVDAIQTYIAAHPKSAIQDEVDASLRAALLADLSKAKEVGTLSALRKFAESRPDHKLDAELAQAMHDVFETAYAKYKAKAGKDPQAVAFVKKLLAWSEKNGPKVEVRFKRTGIAGLKRIDKIVAKNPWFLGEVSYPSHYFDVKDLVPHEKSMTETIVGRFSSTFSPELLALSAGDDLAEDAPDPPPVKLPTLAIAHGEDWSGTAFASNKSPRGIFVGVTYTFDAAFVIPGDAQPLHIKLESVQPVPPAIIKDWNQPGVLEERIYTAMSKEAFAAFGKKLLDAFYAP
jgi:hypothetical protein